MRGDDKAIFVVNRNHSIDQKRIISNHSRAPLSYEDVVPQHHSFSQYSSGTVLEVEEGVDCHY